MKKRTLSFLTLLVFPLLGCSDEKLTPLEMLSTPAGYVSLKANICTAAPIPGQQKLKYLFILDHSSSNKPGFALTPDDITNTDASGNRRYGPMVDFLRNLVADPNNQTSFNLINFSDKAAQPSELTGFEANTQSFISIINKDWIGGGSEQAPSPYDSGFTNYQSALELALQLIRKDAQNELASADANIIRSVYQIIFVSDGVPTIASSVNANEVILQTFDQDIKPVVENLLKLKDDPLLGPYITNITLNTAYYFGDTPVVAAQALLEQMADAGHGQALQFGSGENVLYQQFSPPQVNLRNHLVDVLIENENALWWDDGTFRFDSDSDGLPDVVEAELGSKPSLKDSDGNGVSDLVEYRTKGKTCDEATCSASGRDRYAFCAGFSPVTDAKGNVSFPSSSNDGLNDCEKFVLSANRTTFDSNGDFIPDLLSLKNSVPFVMGTAASAYADPFGDGVTNYMKVKLGLPVQISKKNVEIKPRSYTLTSLNSTSPDVDCFELNVNHIAVASYDDTIKLMIVQNNSVFQDKPVLKAAKRGLKGATSVRFVPGDFL